MPLEPALEEVAGKLEPWRRRILANVYRRWADQLEHSAAVMGLVEGAPVEGAAPSPQPLRCGINLMNRRRR